MPPKPFALNCKQPYNETNHKTGRTLAGCPPCLGFSSIRTLNGSRDVEDERNDLVFVMLRYVKATVAQECDDGERAGACTR